MRATFLFTFVLLALTIVECDLTLSQFLQTVKSNKQAPQKRSIEEYRISNVLLPNKRSFGTFVVSDFSAIGDDFKYLNPTPNGGYFEVPIRPTNNYFKGNIEESPDSLVMLTVSNDKAYGYAQYGEESWVIEMAQENKREEPYLRLVESRNDQPYPEHFCGSHGHEFAFHNEGNVSDAEETLRSTERRQVLNVIRLAIECDITFWNYYGNNQTALNYAADVITTVSGIYANEIRATLRLDVFMCGPNAHSYGTTNNRAALDAVGLRWQNNFSGITRDLVALFLGANVGGIAWLNAACSSLGYSVNGMTNWLPGNIFDYVLVAHEIGHNIGTGHTHCYIPPVDNCYASEGGSCYAGAVSVPSTGGSIMSYCHVQPGGTNNLRLSLGAVGMYGTNSERVPATIRTYLNSAGGRANCMPSPGAASTTGRSTTGRAPITSAAAPITSAAAPITSAAAPVTSAAAPVTTAAAPATTSEPPATGASSASGGSGNVESVSEEDRSMFIIIGASAGGGILLIVAAGVAVGLYRRNKRKSDYGGNNNLSLNTYPTNPPPTNPMPTNPPPFNPYAAPYASSPSARSNPAMNQSRPPAVPYPSPQQRPPAVPGPSPQQRPPGQNRPNPNPKPIPPTPGQTFAKGASVMATYSGDGRPYRAVIVDYKNGKYLVQYPEYDGEQEWLPPSAVRKM